MPTESDGGDRKPDPQERQQQGGPALEIRILFKDGQMQMQWPENNPVATLGILQLAVRLVLDKITGSPQKTSPIVRGVPGMGGPGGLPRM